MSETFDRELEERLVRYARIDTESAEASSCTPSTDKQYDLLNLLAGELREMGAEDVTLTNYGAVLATIPPTAEVAVPTIALLAHVDTTEAFAGAAVEPIVHRGYGGGDISYPDNPDLVLSPDVSPYLAGKTGEDIITASGTTLLGADDKAGVAIIMTMARHLLDHPEIAHGPIRVCFTPDEEIGRGVDSSLPRDLGADVGYTLDGGEAGEVVYETFSADKAVVSVTGVSAHPGDAKGILVNALHLASKIVMTLPHVTRTPEVTDGREGSSTSMGWRAMRPRPSFTSSCATSSGTGLPITATCSNRSAPPCRRRSRALTSRARSRRNIAICATGWRTTRVR